MAREQDHLKPVHYLSGTSPKSNSAYTAIGKAQELVQQTGNLEVPDHLKNASSALARNLGHGKGYLYPHDHSGLRCARILAKRHSRQCIWSPAATKRTANQRPTKGHVER